MDDKERNGLLKKVTAKIEEILDETEECGARVFGRLKVAEMAMQNALGEIEGVLPIIEKNCIGLAHFPEVWGHLSAATIILEGTLAAFSKKDSEEE